jgi:predicted nucleic acid-binding protein
MIPVMARPRNDSLEFVKTIGRLYHEKRDNKNLSKKMAAYFLEHVRNRYKLSTNQFDDEFIISLQRKTAQPEKNIREIISFINNIDETDEIADEQLAGFHKRLEDFYKTG